MTGRLHIGTWLWGSKYGSHYVNRLERGVARNIPDDVDYDWHVWEPRREDEHLTHIPGCMCRLRMWSEEWQDENNIAAGDTVVCLDLDTVVTGDIGPLFAEGDDDFAILLGANSANPCPYTGCAMMFRAGTHPEVWDDFSYEAVVRTPFFEFPDDQGWLSVKLPHAKRWQVGAPSGLYAFQKPGWPKGSALPKDARLVSFPGHRDPGMFGHLDWVKHHWTT